MGSVCEAERRPIEVNVSELANNTCKNCGAFSSGKYCPDCGQRMAVHKVTFGETFSDLIDTLFSVNAPLFVTLRELIVSPGKLLRNYLGGQRKKYYKPVAFFILTTVLYIVIRTIIGFDPFRNDAFQVQDGADGATKFEEARNYFLLNINNLLFIFVFTLAIFSKLFYHRRYSLAEFLVISFYLLGIYTLLSTIDIVIIQFITDKAQGVRILVMMIYFIYAMLSLLKKPIFVVVLKSIVVYLLSFVFYFAMSYGLSYLIVLFK
ncbi:DUF3667 domain-containing protein [Flavobacteriaceae bacterium D16]|nr:DUF3667 domain-containing protein [Flavobacteriaceae bacterium D16]